MPSQLADALPASLTCSGALSAADGFSLTCAAAGAASTSLPSAVHAHAHSHEPAPVAVAHEDMARAAVLGSAFALPLLFFFAALVRSAEFRAELLADPLRVLRQGDRVIVAALQEPNLRPHAKALLRTFLLPVMALAVLLIVADAFTERDLVSEILAGVHYFAHLHPLLTPLVVVGVPTSIWSMLQSIYSDARAVHGLPFHHDDVVEFPQISALSRADAAPPGLLVVNIDSLDHKRVELRRLCDGVSVYMPLEEARRLTVIVRVKATMRLWRDNSGGGRAAAPPPPPPRLPPTTTTTRAAPTEELPTPRAAPTEELPTTRPAEQSGGGSSPAAPPRARPARGKGAAALG